MSDGLAEVIPADDDYAEDLVDDAYFLALPRPKTRGECGEERPCPWVSCRYHLYLDVNPKTGTIRYGYPGREPWEIPETCALDVADRGGEILEDIGDMLNVTRERIRQIERKGKEAAAPHLRKFGVDECGVLEGEGSFAIVSGGPG